MTRLRQKDETNRKQQEKKDCKRSPFLLLFEITLQKTTIKHTKQTNKRLVLVKIVD